MSTVIECPECCTRYKMNKAIPEGGRSVKCARCGHQWRVTPEAALDEAAGTRLAHQNIMEGEQNPASSAETTQASTPFPPPPPLSPPPPPAETASDDFSDWQTRREFHAFAVSDMQNEANEEDSSETSMLDSNTLKDSWMGYESDSHPQNSQGDGYDETSMHGAAGDDEIDWAKNIQEQSWNNIGEQMSDENPEFAVRSALNSALEPNDYEHNQDALSSDDEPFNEFWEGFSAERDNTDLDGDAPAYGDKDLKTVAAEIQNARRNSVIYDASTTREGFSDEDEFQSGDPDSEADFALQQNMAEALRAAGSNDDTPFGKNGPTAFSGAEQGDDFPYGAEYIDGDTAALQNQLEKYEHMPYEAPRRGGGLALVAAWAVFLSIASGLILALVNMRSDIATALPGTAGLYHLAGFTDVGHDIDFSNVSYHWTGSGDQPVVMVTGRVINRTNHTIQVPQVLINMRDKENTDVLRKTESVQTAVLDSQQSADFSFELAVSKSISQIELEFDRIQ